MDGPWALDSSRCLVHLVAGMDGGKRRLQSLALSSGNLCAISAMQQKHNA